MKKMPKDVVFAVVCIIVFVVAYLLTEVSGNMKNSFDSPTQVPTVDEYFDDSSKENVLVKMNNVILAITYTVDVNQPLFKMPLSEENYEYAWRLVNCTIALEDEGNGTSVVCSEQDVKQVFENLFYGFDGKVLELPKNIEVVFNENEKTYEFIKYDCSNVQAELKTININKTKETEDDVDAMLYYELITPESEGAYALLFIELVKNKDSEYGYSIYSIAYEPIEEEANYIDQ